MSGECRLMIKTSHVSLNRGMRLLQPCGTSLQCVQGGYYLKRHAVRHWRKRLLVLVPIRIINLVIVAAIDCHRMLSSGT